MEESQVRKFQKDLNGGLVALVLLAVLAATQEDLYGYEIAKRLQKANEGEALFKEGTVYPVLRALSAAGLLTSRTMLRQYRDVWRQTRDFVDRFIEAGITP